MLRKAINLDSKKVQIVLHQAFKKNAIKAFPFSAALVTEDKVAEWISNSEVYVYEKQNTIAGVFRLSRYSEYGLVLSRLAVSPKFSGQQLGSKLVSFAEVISKELKERSLTLKTPREHPYLVGYYKALGYEPNGFSFKSGDKYVEVVLSKVL